VAVHGVQLSSVGVEGVQLASLGVQCVQLASVNVNVCVQFINCISFKIMHCSKNFL